MPKEQKPPNQHEDQKKNSPSKMIFKTEKKNNKDGRKKDYCLLCELFGFEQAGTELTGETCTKSHHQPRAKVRCLKPGCEFNSSDGFCYRCIKLKKLFQNNEISLDFLDELQQKLKIPVNEVITRIMNNTETD